MYIVCLWQSRKFRILLYCREKNAHVKVLFNKNIEFEKQGVCVGEDDVYFNCTNEKNQLMNGSVPWRGAREKHPILMQMFIEALCKPGAVVIDVTASTGGFTILISTINIQFFYLNDSIDFSFIQCNVMLIKNILIFYFFSFQVPLSTHVVKVDAILLLMRQMI